MKDSVERMRMERKGEGLSRMVKTMKYQQYCESVLKNGNHTYVELYKHYDSFRARKGVVEKSSSVLVQLNVERVVEVNVESRQLLNVNEIKHKQVLDLNDEGERWEGDVLRNQPYGWGVLYDKEGEKVYEGFRIGDVNVCYGTQYYADIQKVEYEGEICEGKRWGRGIQYDRNGVVVYDGEWLNDGHVEKRMVMNNKTQYLHSCIEELIVSNKSCNGEEWSGLDLSLMPSLTVLHVGDCCFENVTEVKLIGLKKLESVVIGWDSFTRDSTPMSINPNRHFYLKDCEQLKELKMGCESFVDYSVCEIANVPSLEGIEMGKLNEGSCNFYCASLELKSDDDGMK